jgi:TonB family protein
MKATACCVLLVAVFAARLHSQKPPTIDMGRMKAFQKQLVHDNIYNWISTDFANGLLLQKSEPVIKNSPADSHRMGTVVVAFEIGKSGEVKHPTVMSGPKELQKSVLDAVRRYKYKPYLANGAPSAVATTVSVTVYDY